MKKTLNTLKNNEEFEINDFELNEIEFNDIQDIEDEEDIPKEKIIKVLSDDIKSLREKNKQFQATNDKQTYLIVVFSTNEDKSEFLKNVNIEDYQTHTTMVDGYKLAKNIGIAPQKPKFKLARPIESHHTKK
jgi:uncharacterized protein involved in high-affinity Fe2+ transport